MSANPEIKELKGQIESLKNSLIEAKEENHKLSEELDKSKPSWSGTWEMDLLTKQVSWSNEMYLILGLDSSIDPDMAHLKNKLELACQDKLNGALNKTFHTKKDYSFEHFINVGDNKPAARTDLKPILDENQNLIKLVGKLTDISQTKSDQKELEKLSLIAAHTSNAVVMLNTDAEILWVNSAFTMMTGYRLDEVDKQPFSIIFKDKESELCLSENLNDEFQRVNSLIQETQIRTKNNELHWGVFNISPILDYSLNPEGFIAIITDINHQKEVEIELASKNIEITDSIKYASRIQNTILTNPDKIKKWLPESFILFKPKDIVSGDFYWINKKENIVYFSAIDCTGHGVPGAMVSMVAHGTLQRAVTLLKLRSTADILNNINETIAHNFNKNSEEGEVKDGMDLALCAIDLEQMKLSFAGANNPVYIIRQGELIEIKGNKQPIGHYEFKVDFTEHQFDLQKGDTIYVSTDGYPDQFGGPKGKKFKYKQFKELLLSIQEKSMKEQHKILDTAFESWRGDLEQVDDVCIVGVRV